MDGDAGGNAIGVDVDGDFDVDDVVDVEVEVYVTNVDDLCEWIHLSHVFVIFIVIFIINNIFLLFNWYIWFILMEPTIYSRLTFPFNTIEFHFICCSF